MWKWLHQLGMPQQMFYVAGRCLPFFLLATLLILPIGWIWGFGFAPADYQQGQSYRIMYLHVPAAILSMVIYTLMAVSAFTGLVWQLKMADMVARAMAPIGACFTFIALLSGACWGKPMWGTWWIWDARLTSELILLFLYMGVIALEHAFDDRRIAGRACSIVILAGVVNLPIIHYSVQWWNTLHQGSSGLLQQSIALPMRTPLRISIVGCLLFFITLTLYRLRTLILISEHHRAWVEQTINKTGN